MSRTNNTTVSAAEITIAIKRTLAYAAVFAARPPARVVWQWLLSTQPIGWPLFWSVWQSLDLSAFHFWQSKSRSVLPELEPVRQKKAALNKMAFWRQVAPAVTTWSRIPGIESIWITGSWAAAAAQPNDDIDFMIVCAPHRLWWVRLWVVLLSWGRGRYRRYGLLPNQVAGKWCCNLWLTTNTLALPPAQRQLYTARELVQAVPVWARRRGAAEQLILANTWVAQYTANGFWFARRRARQTDQRCVWQTPVAVAQPNNSMTNGVVYFFSALTNTANTAAQAVQWWWMRRHHTQEIIEPERAFFHPHNLSSSVLARYETICRQQGIAPWY